MSVFPAPVSRNATVFPATARSSASSWYLHPAAWGNNRIRTREPTRSPAHTLSPASAGRRVASDPPPPRVRRRRPWRRGFGRGLGLGEATSARTVQIEREGASPSSIAAAASSLRSAPSPIPSLICSAPSPRHLHRCPCAWPGARG